MSKKKFDNITVVPVDDFSFEQVLENKLYAYPASISRKIHDYIAFYRTAPKSSITHLAEVKEVIEGGSLNEEYRRKAFGRKKNQKATKVKLGRIEKLNPPISAGEDHFIQNHRYTTLERIKEARNIEDI